MKTKKKKYCMNCTNKIKPNFVLHIGGLKIDLCSPCWIGHAIALKINVDKFLTNPEQFIQSATKANDLYK